MENHPNMESFEKFIRQQADEFRMYPSKRVWYSIYNNIHPGRKWPSISMCIVLLSALLTIGYLNTKNNIITTENSSIAQNRNNTLTVQTAAPNLLLAANSQTIVHTNSRVNAANTFVFDDKAIKTPTVTEKKVKANIAEKKANNFWVSGNNTTNNRNFKILSSYKKKLTSPAKKSTNVIVSDGEEIKLYTASSLPNNNAEKTNGENNNSSNYNLDNNNNLNSYNWDNNSLHNQHNVLNDANDASVPQKIFNSYQINTIEPALLAVDIATNYLFNKQLANTVNLNISNTATKITDKQWIENYAMYNRPVPRKWKGKLAWQAHFTPSVIYRHLYNNTTGKNISGNTFATSLNNLAINNAVKQTPSIGLEAGASLQYPLFKGLKLKAGLQLNYTRFNISAFSNAHPNATSLTMNNGNNGQVYELSRSTPYSNIVGLNSQKLHNQTYQLSLPIGADIKLAGIDNVEWYAGATIQPTFVFAANSYLVSTDRRSYVKENSMLNHFNMNAGFETYISFKTAAEFTWQIGPQFRKQLFSTNSSRFSIEERIMSYGIKIGVSKKL